MEITNSDSFEQLLQKQNSRMPKSVFYNKVLNTTHETCKPQQVLDSVLNQIKAIHSADCLTSATSTSLRRSIMKGVKKSNFLTVNKLPLYCEVPKSTPNKFESQCVSDTQLINIIETAEAIDTNTGMTEEFNTTFTHFEDRNTDYVKHEAKEFSQNIHSSIMKPRSPIYIDKAHTSQSSPKDSVKKTNNANKGVCSLTSDIGSQLLKSAAENSITIIQNEQSTIENNDEDIFQYDSQDVDLNTGQCTETSSPLLNNIYQSLELMDVDNSECTHRSLSPVINVKTKTRKTRTPSPLVVSLTAFENFENVANLFIEGNDLETAKHLINSQILGRELCLNTNTDILFMDRNDSPILELKSDELQINLEDLRPPKFNDTPKNMILLKNITNVEKRSEVFKDEILFSSDEETEYIHKEMQNLPLTCALETTSYNQLSTLDRTMYVGFQTASNKSIQICTDSYDKAQNFLKDNDITVNEINLTELVKNCDNFNSKPDKSINIVSVTISENEGTHGLESILNPIDQYQLRKEMSKELCEKPQISSNVNNEIYSGKDNNNGFITASYNTNKMSEKDKSQKVFKEIDLSKNCINVEDSINRIYCIDPKVCIDVKSETVDIQSMKTDLDKNDNIIDNKINDEDLLEEFDNIEMSFDKSNNKEEGYIVFGGFELAYKENIKAATEPVVNDAHVSKDTGVKIFELKNAVDKDTSSTKEVLSFIKTTSVDSKNMIGFKTASKKNIEVSAQAFAKTKNVFQDIEIETKNALVNLNNKIINKNVITKPLADNKSFFGFKTANNKTIKISEPAVLKSKNLFRDISINNYELDKIEDLNQLFSSPKVFSGFKTVNNKQKIKIPDQVPPNFSHIFNNVKKENFNISKIANLNKTPISKNPFVGFKTAANKDINISIEALFKSKDLFKDIDKESYEMETNIVVSGPLVGKPLFQRFKTASNKNIEISERSLSKCKDVFKDIDREKLDIDVINDINILSIKSADNKYVRVIDDALTKSNNNFQDMEIDTFVQSRKVAKIKPESGFIGFKTASNKNVAISVQALEKSRQLFQDIDMTTNISLKNTNNLQDVNRKVGRCTFQTAHHKEVNISKEALIYNENEILDLETNPECRRLMRNAVNKDKNAMYIDFQTTSKKPITISSDALAKSKIIPENIEKADGTIPESLLKSFQTANRKDVKDTKEDLFASKNVLDNLIENFTDNSKSAFFGFKTASNKSVTVSDAALAKCKTIFDIQQEVITEQDQPRTEGKEEICKEFQNNIEGDNENEALEKTKKSFGNIDVSVKEKKTFNGFLTANNQTVNVTKQALAKSKQLFHNIDMDNDISIKHVDDIYDNNKVNINNLKRPSAETLAFKTCIKKDIEVLEDALIKSKKLFDEHTVNGINERPNRDNDTIKETLHIEGIFNTQVVNNFNESLCTEDFKDSPKENKRSGSPILPCPKAKKRKKFEIPYKSIPKTVIDFDKAVEEVKKTVSLIQFKDDYKKTKKYTLKEISDFENGKRTSIIDPYIMNFNLDNILSFTFEGERNDFKKGKVTIKDIKTLFKDAIDNKLIPEGWLDIHLKLILWKLISYEIRFPSTLGIVCTVRNVIDQLKYRYDKELYNTERPVLRKILEKDDISTNAMVLCVAGIYVDGVSVTRATNLTRIELLLTDGWYFIKATIDRMLSKLVFDGKIAIGRKMMISGAELVNCDQGVAPWEDTSSVRLSISGNSCAPVPWYSRLGLCPEGRPVRLSRLVVEGGRARRVRLLVTRVYPTLYVEKLNDGSTVTRSERLEHLYQVKYEAEREALIEKIYEEVEKELSDQESQESEDSLLPNVNNKMRTCFESGSQIAKVMKSSKDPAEFRAQLTSSQVRLLEEHASKQRDKYMEAIHCRVRDRVTSRNVVALARGRVAGLEGGTAGTVTKGMLSIWKPNEAILDIFREGAWIEVMNVVPTAFRNSEIQLSAGRQSMFRPFKYKNEHQYNAHLQTLKRKCFKIEHLACNTSMITDYNEIDTVGIIFTIDPPNMLFDSIKNQFQNMYLSDVDKNIICVNFWGGTKKFGFENVLDTGQVIYCGNLQKRAGNTRKNIPQYRATEFSVFTKTPKNESARELMEEINKKLLGLDRRKFCEDCTAIMKNYSVIKSVYGRENVSPYRFNNSDYNLGKNKMFIDTPMAFKAKGTSDDFSLTGLDFESTFRQDTQKLSPRTLLRKNKVNEKIAKLKKYGEPPPLSHMNITNKSKHAADSYKSPLISRTSITANKIIVATDNNLQNVATPTKLIRESARSSVVNKKLPNSPILPMNRTFVKTIAKPIKLNFSDCVASNEKTDISVDHFADDFDGSPPLSLD